MKELADSAHLEIPLMDLVQPDRNQPVLGLRFLEVEDPGMDHVALVHRACGVGKAEIAEGQMVFF